MVDFPRPERTALKEWAVVADALGRGDIIGILRSGGIRDQRRGFRMKEDRFWLYPTLFHGQTGLVAPRFAATVGPAMERHGVPGQVRLEYLAQPAIIWRIRNLETIREAQHELGISWKAIEKRFYYRDPGAQFITLRVERLRKPVIVPEAPRYAGCVSWVELDDGADYRDVEPVLPEEEFERRLSALLAVLRKDRPSPSDAPPPWLSSSDWV